MKNYAVYLFNLILSSAAIIGGAYIIRNFIGKMSVLNFIGWVLCFAGALAIFFAAVSFIKRKRAA